MKKLWLVLVLYVSAAGACAQEVATLRVGLWTLWHDREVTVNAAQDGDASARTCERCSAGHLTEELQLRAENDTVVLGNRRAALVWLSGTLLLTGPWLSTASSTKI